MHPTKLSLVYFSPTGSTKRVLEMIAGKLHLETAEYDLTTYAGRAADIQFGPEEFVLFGCPVYGGRVPRLFVERLSGVTGSGTPCALVATYGNREYEDALLELKNITKASGFRAVGAAAIVTEHSILRAVAAGRPDERDIAFIKGFALALRQKLEDASAGEAYPELIVPGNEPYRNYSTLGLTPDGSPKCAACGLCVKKCPVGAISADHPRETDQGKCIGCMRCVRLCPSQARNLARGKAEAVELHLKKAMKNRKEPEMFL